MGDDPELRRIIDRKMESFLARRLAKTPREEPDGVVEVSDDDFGPTVLEAGRPAIVDFWAEWCRPCREMEPVFRKVASRHRDGMLFARLNVEENRGVATSFFVMSIPTMIIFSGGAERERIVGMISERDLERAITSYISG